MLKALGLAGVMLLSTAAAYAQSDPAAFLKEVNRDNDKTLSLQELNYFAVKKFHELNTKGTKTLSRRELGDRISDADFAAANTDRRKDQTLSLSEFIKYVDLLFREANTKGTKTLSLAELSSPAGHKLIRLLH